MKKIKDKDHVISFLISLIFNGALLYLLVINMTSNHKKTQPISTVMILEEVINTIKIDDVIDLTIKIEENIFKDFQMEFTSPILNLDEFNNSEPEITSVESQLGTLLTDIISPISMAGVGNGFNNLRGQRAVKFGGPNANAGQNSVILALNWLQRHQLDNGGWSLNGNVGSACPGQTGLALLAFLSHGETPSSEKYGRAVSRAIRWIVENQNANGIIGRSQHTAYGHAMSTYALAEAYSITNNMLIREPLVMAIDVIIRGMHQNGGFDYNYNVSNRNDSSVGGWQVQALKASVMAFPDNNEYRRSLQLAINGMLLNSRLTNGARTIGYTSQGNNANITAAGALGMIFSGRIRDRQTRELITSIEDITPAWNVSQRHSIYQWYYVGQALFQFDESSEHFRRFNNAMSSVLINNQNSDGSWDEPGGGGSNGKTGATAMGALNLMVYYRHLPTNVLKEIRANLNQTITNDDVITISL